MFTKIIRNEWRNLLSERSFLLLIVVFAVLLGYGIQSGGNWIKQREAHSKTLLGTQEKDLAEKREKVTQGFKGSTETDDFEPNPADPYEIGMGLQHAVLPFTSTAVLSVGQADVLPIDAGVTISTLQRTTAEKDGFENPLSFLTGRFDLSFVVVYLLPLFVLAMSFNLLSAERENGTLQLLLANPLKLKNLLTAKVTAQFGLILGIVLSVSLIGVLLTANVSAEGFWSRVLLWIVLVAVYSAFWFSLAVFINSFGFSSATNAVISSATWLILVLILPSLLNVAISAIYPVPPRSEIISAERAVNLDMRKEGSKLLTEHYQDHPELMPKGDKPDLNDFGLAFVYIQQRKKEKVQEVENRFNDQLGKQQNLVRNLRFLSPSIIMQEALNDIAGTGLERYTHFRGQVKEFDKEWTDYFTPKIYRLENLSVADFEQIPRFKFQEESFTSLFDRVIYGVLFLLVASAVLMYLAFAKLQRYRLGR